MVQQAEFAGLRTGGYCGSRNLILAGCKGGLCGKSPATGLDSAPCFPVGMPQGWFLAEIGPGREILPLQRDIQLWNWVFLRYLGHSRKAGIVWKLNAGTG